ncbi:hypothetical protein ALP75_205289 [Pseudomonas syringae pv. actinidiae]|nr:hypothetical protein ALP75_205289 [Pseudomonas syringae pv. actinidiae]
MHVANAFDVLAQNLQRLAAAHIAMPRIEQQPDLVAGQRHQLVDVLRRFDVSAHVVVIRQTHTTGQGEARQFGEFVGVFPPGRIAVKTWPFDQRDAQPLNGVGHFAVHQHRSAVLGEQLHMRSNGFDFFGHRALRQTA